MPDEPEDLADVPPEEFVAARDARAKQLKADGKATEAAEVKKLRKPTVTRWVADQVRRHHAEEVEALRAALSKVAAAQETAITSGDRGALAEATAHRRDAMTALGGAVDDVLAASDRRRSLPATEWRSGGTQMPGLRSKRRRPALCGHERSSRPPRRRSRPCVSAKAEGTAAKRRT